MTQTRFDSSAVGVHVNCRVVGLKFAPVGRGPLETLTVSPGSVSVAFTVNDTVAPVLTDRPVGTWIDRAFVWVVEGMSINRVEFAVCC